LLSYSTGFDQISNRNSKKRLNCEWSVSTDEKHPWNKFNASNNVVLETVGMNQKVSLAHYFLLYN